MGFALGVDYFVALFNIKTENDGNIFINSCSLL